MPTANLTLVEVRGKYVKTDGTPVEGTVRFTPNAPRLVDSTAVTTVISAPVETQLVNGEFAVSLPATDDPDVLPTGFSYRVVEEFVGGVTFNMSVPSSMAGSGLDISSAAPGPASGGTAGQSAALIRDQTLSAKELAVAAAVEAEGYADAVANLTPGTELGYVERLTTWTTTAVGLTATIPGMTLSVVGTGRLADIELGFGGFYHSVANTKVSAAVSVNGDALSAKSVVLAGRSSVNTEGLTVYGKRRVLLNDGVTYNLAVYVWGAAVGTTTVAAAGFLPTYLSVTSR